MTLRLCKNINCQNFQKLKVWVDVGNLGFVIGYVKSIQCLHPKSGAIINSKSRLMNRSTLTEQNDIDIPIVTSQAFMILRM